MPSFYQILLLWFTISDTFNTGLAIAVPGLFRSETTACNVSNKNEPATRPVHSHTIRQTEDYYPESYFVFHQFERAVDRNGALTDAAYKLLFTRAIVEIMPLLNAAITTATVESLKQQPSDPTFIRYFGSKRESASTIQGVVTRTMQAIGSPPWNQPQLRNQCAPQLERIHIYYGDPPRNILKAAGGALCSDIGGSAAYVFSTNENVYFSDGLAVCDTWFGTFRSFQEIDITRIGPYLEFGYRNVTNEPTYFSAQYLLHGE